MKLGFIGTGAITSAIVTGLSSPDTKVGSIVLSPRNAAIATDLANTYASVVVAPSNQKVLDLCETVVIAVRADMAASVLSGMQFRPDHRVISLVSALPIERLSQLLAPATHITRAVPLPSTAKRIGPTAIYPADPETEHLFAGIGTVFTVATECEFDAMCAATATIATFYVFADSIAACLSRNGVSESKSRDYVARMLLGVMAGAVDSHQKNFRSLASEHATQGGINEQLLQHMVEHGFVENLSRGLQAVMERIRAAGQHY